MATRAELEAYIRRGAAARGLDPDFWVKVVEGESRFNPAARARTPKEDSGGLFQLNTKGGLGVEALRRGINPHDPNQWQAQTDFALDQAKKSHRPWTVARQLKGEKTPGIPTNPVARNPAAPPPTRRPDGAPGPRDAPVAPVNPQQGTLASIYEPFQKLAIEQKEQQVEQQLAAAQALAADRPPVEQSPPPPAMPAALPPDFAALMFPRIRRGLLGDDSYGLLS